MTACLKSKEARIRKVLKTLSSMILCFLLTSCHIPDMLKDNELYSALNSGNLERIKESVDGGADVNRTSWLYALHECPLLFSIQNGQRCIPEYLLSAGADPNYIDESHGISILMYAVGAHAESGLTYSNSTDNDVYQVLLNDPRTDVNLTGRLGYTELDFACRYNGRLEIVHDLLDHDARVSATTLELAVEGCRSRHCDELVVKLIYDCLIEQEVQITLDPEIEAVLHGETDRLLSLVHAEKVKQENVQILMLLACAFGDAEAVQSLAEDNPDFFGGPSEGTHWGNICVGAACSFGKPETVEYLMNEHVNTEILATELYTHQSKTPLTYALQHDRLDIADYLFELGAELQIAGIGTSGNRPDVLEISCRNGNLDTIKWVISHGYPLEEERCERAMAYAAGNDHIDVLEYFLIDLGIDINVEFYYGTVLGDSIRSANLETIRFLIDNGADVNGGMDRIFTPVNHAVSSYRADALLCLIENGADINNVGCTDDGYSPSHPLTLAIKNGYFEIVQILVEHGAILTYQEGWTNGRDTPLEIAERQQSQRIITYLNDALGSLGT